MQSSFPGLEFADKKRLTRRYRFLARIHAATPWAAPEAEIELYYQNGEGLGRTPIGLSGAAAAAAVATALLKLGRLLDGLTCKIFEANYAHLAEQGLILREGTIVDALPITALHSTKSEAKARDHEMQQTKKSNNRHFCAKVYIGVDDKSGLVHTLAKTAANMSDLSQVHALADGHERTLFGAAYYKDVQKRPERAKVGPSNGWWR